MTSNTLIAIIVASIIAVFYFIAVIVFIIWKCKSKDKKPKKKLSMKFYSTQPTILKRHPPTLAQLMLNKKAQLHYKRPMLYTLPMTKQVNPNQVNPNQVNPNQVSFNKQQKKKKQHEKVWPALNSIPTFGRTFVWRQIENESGHEDLQKNKEEDKSPFSDRQRKPHIGSIRHLPSDNEKTCKF